MSAKTKREERRERGRKHKTRIGLIWGAIGLIILTAAGFVVWQGIKPSAGEAVAIMESPHIDTDSDPGQYSSDPPTSGPHYPDEAEAGFFDTNIYQYPAGYLVHNLEHGYIIFWYNCDLLTEPECTTLKTQLKEVINDLGRTKVIAYPWPSIDVPVVATSWGRLQQFETFDTEQAKAFYRANLNRAPEPNAP